MDKPLVIGQIPHHGALSNHNNTFWKKRNRFEESAMVVSSGPNSYNHPSTQVLDFFIKNRYNVFSTSKTLLANDLINSDTLKEIIQNLDIYSYPESFENSKIEGDQSFSIDLNDKCYKYLPSS